MNYLQYKLSNDRRGNRPPVGRIGKFSQLNQTVDWYCCSVLLSINKHEQIAYQSEKKMKSERPSSLLLARFLVPVSFLHFSEISFPIILSTGFSPDHNSVKKKVNGSFDDYLLLAELWQGWLIFPFRHKWVNYAAITYVHNIKTLEGERRKTDYCFLFLPVC